MLYKGRERKIRGKLEKFSDLPDYPKITFRLIKKVICEHFKKDIDVYVYGSYKHGYWDDESDFDVIINEDCDMFEMEKLIFDKLGVKNNVLITDNKIGVVLIP